MFHNDSAIKSEAQPLKWLILVLFGCAVAFSPSAWPKTPEEIFVAVAPSIVVVETHDASGQPITIGSGVVVFLGEVVTNCHVVKNDPIINVKQGEIAYPATIHYADRDRDLCQLSVSGLKAPPAIRGSVSDLNTGARVVAIGAPQGLELSISEGLVSSLRELEDGSKLIQTTAPISPGSSGGGLFNDEGLLVGITTLFLEDSQNLNFALPIDWIWDLIFIDVEEVQENSLSSQSVEEEKALEDIRTLGESLRAVDPNFSAKEKYFKSMIEPIVSSGIPPSEWPAAIEKAYWALPDGDSLRWANRSLELRKSKDWQGLVAHARNWVKAEPENAKAWFSLGNGRIGLRNKYSASAGALVRNAQNTPDYNYRGMFMDQHDAQISYAELENVYAIEAYREAVRLEPTFTHAWFYLGSAFKYDENQIGASAAYQKLKKLDPELAEKLYTLRRCFCSSFAFALIAKVALS